jgi:1-phosphatidylinositol phosphodiesterase
MPPLPAPPSWETSTWLSSLSSSLPLSSLFLPGTHESCALYGWPFSQCQRGRSILVQLQDGIRFLDIRLSIKQHKLIAYHGVQSQVIHFAEEGGILDQVQAFLEKNVTETVVMSVKQV